MGYMSYADLQRYESRRIIPSLRTLLFVAFIMLCCAIPAEVGARLAAGLGAALKSLEMLASALVLGFLFFVGATVVLLIADWTGVLRWLVILLLWYGLAGGLL